MSHAHSAAIPHDLQGGYPIPPASVDRAKVTFAPGAGRALSAGLLLVGALGLVLTVILAFGGSKDALKHAVAAYHVGFMYALGLSLGSLGLVMILHQFNAGWTATVRRQLENVASLMPVVAVLGLPVLAVELMHDGLLFKWMNDSVRAGDHILQHKAGYLNEPFFIVRAVLYFGVWSFLAVRLNGFSRTQDETGDRWLTARARFMSAYGLPLFALTTAFAGFDWLMSQDFHWFSTMWGVYFFAGNNVAATALLIVTLMCLRRAGKLQGMVTAEHDHDLGKMLLAFTVFWAYIGFSQYFLIWYSNIPEESAWFVHRNTNGWQNVALLLVVGHFALPFLVLLWRASKRVPLILGTMAVWLLAMHAVDLFFIVRPGLALIAPETYGGSTGLERWWFDAAGFAGPVALFLGLVVRKVVSAPLIPLNDPRLSEALEHKNYV